MKNLNLKEKIKNLFKIPDEVFEEEPSPNFERQKVCTLTRKNIFLGLFLFTLIVNIFVLFDLNFIYLRQILGFLFLISVPGILIILCFKIREIRFWEYLVYTVGLSISFIMFAGLIVNWTLPLLGITDKPLTIHPILICFDIFLVILGGIAFLRNKDLKHKLTMPKLDLINNVFFIVPLFFPVLAILGAFLLNNHGTNILTMIMLGGVAVYVLLLTIFRKKLDKNIYPWAILLIAISFIISGWMRGGFIFGVDNSLEFNVFKMSLLDGKWDFARPPITYNAMLSLSILPCIVYFFTGVSIQILFKLILPLLFSIIFLISFLYFQKIFNQEIAFFSFLFLISLPMLHSGFSIALRQGIAFIFFCLLLLTLLSPEISQRTKKSLFLIFGSSMIVSHYSTSYITLAILFLSYFLVLLYEFISQPKMLNLRKKSNPLFYLGGVLIFLLILFGFLWYNQVTSADNTLVTFLGKSFTNLGKMFQEDVQAGNGGIIQNILTFRNYQQPQAILEDYLSSVDIQGLSGTYIDSSNYQLRLESSYGNLLFDKTSTFLITFKKYVEFLSRVFIFPGVILFLFFTKRIKGLVRNANPEKKTLFKVFSLATLFIGVSFLFLPFFSLSYGIERAYQQIILVLAPFAIIGLLFSLSLILKSKLWVKIICVVSLIVYLLTFSGFIFSIYQVPEIPLKVENYGREFNYYYSRSGDISSFQWLANLNSTISLKGAGSSIMKQRFLIEGLPINIAIKNCIFPSCITKNDYVFSGYINKLHNLAVVSINSNWITISFPTEFIEKNKDKVYNNGGSEIYK